MNRIPESDAKAAFNVCKEVYQNVSIGIAYPPLPQYSDQEYTQAIESVLPVNYTINPPSMPVYDAVYSSARDARPLGMHAAGGLLFLSIFSLLL
jgi:hypothetical protein